MKSSCILALIVFSLAATLRAQKQEQNMLERIQNPKMEASQMQNKQFGNSAGFKATRFEAGAFSVSKSAPVKSFSSRSFFGIKNPWLGGKAADTTASAFANRKARESETSFFTKSAKTSTAIDADKSADFSATLPRSMSPRSTTVEPKAQGGVDQFTQNLNEDLSIDDVRALLNKGKEKP